MTEPLISTENLCVDFALDKHHVLHALSTVTLAVYPGETVGLVGESGCGKTTLGRTMKGLYPAKSGKVYYNGQSITEMNRAQRAAFTKETQMIFQDPYSSLDPRMTVRDIVREGMRAHHMGTLKQQSERVSELLEIVGLSREHANRFPHEFSGGQRQRIGIARALALDPKFIICDEPTSALDVSIQAQVIALLKSLQQTMNLTYLFISHDLAMVKYLCDRIVVMYLGEIVEIAPSEELYKNPMHPYTRTLISAIQVPDPKAEAQRRRIHMKGDLPSLMEMEETGCKFYNRCPCAVDACKKAAPFFREVAPGHFTACDRGTLLTQSDGEHE